MWFKHFYCTLLSLQVEERVQVATYIEITEVIMKLRVGNFKISSMVSIVVAS